jgi:proteic killer suppression protein
MIEDFFDKETEKVFNGTRSKKLPSELQNIMRRKLKMIDAVKDLNELRNPPSNHLEALTRDRKGQHSIRINLKWRICFIWNGQNFQRVEITDYH